MTTDHHAPGLEDGCSPTTPDDDSLQRQYVLAHASRVEAEARAMGDEVVRADDLVFGHRGLPHPMFNQCVLLRPVTGISLTALQEQVAACVAFGSPISIWSLWPTGDLSDLGLVLGGHPPLMARPAGPAPASSSSPDGLRITEVTDDDGVATFARTAAVGFGLQLVGDGKQAFDERILGTGWRAWVGYLDGEAVATAASRAAYGVNLVEIVSTLAPARGRGVGAAVTWAATLGDPALPAVLLASDLGRPVYARMGYLTLSRATLWLGGFS
jgi:hypothetical protein